MHILYKADGCERFFAAQREYDVLFNVFPRQLKRVDCNDSICAHLHEFNGQKSFRTRHDFERDFVTISASSNIVGGDVRTDEFNTNR